jgi:hypothetical protein
MRRRQPKHIEIGKTGEALLAQMVITDAIFVLNAKSKYPTKLNKKQKEVYEWIASDDTEWGYSFVNICHFLRWEPDYMRRLIYRGINPFTVAR